MRDLDLKRWRYSGQSVKDLSGKLYVTDWYANVKKNGEIGKQWLFIPAEFTPLHKCELCGLLGGGRKITHRHDCYGWDCADKDLGGSRYLLCVGCWNRVRVIVKAINSANEIKYLTNKLKREVAKNVKDTKER